MKRNVYTGEVDWRGTAERAFVWIIFPALFWGTVSWIAWRWMR